jgi:hypothetical protein
MLRPEARIAANFLVPLVACGLLFLTGCPGETPQAGKSETKSAKPLPAADQDHNHEHHHHHAEQGPHGGTLVAIGQDDAHLELVLNAETGTLTAYVLDGQAEKAVPIKQKNLQLAITLEHDHDGEHEQNSDGQDEHKDDLPETLVTLMLSAASPGEDGTASEFSGQADELKGAREFEAALTSITIGKTPFTGVTFKYPEGNEHDHHH